MISYGYLVALIISLLAAVTGIILTICICYVDSTRKNYGAVTV